MSKAKLLLAALALASLPGAGEPPAAPHPAGEGVLCSAAIVYAVRDIGKRCFPGQDAEFQNSLAEASDAFDTYILANAPGGRATLDRFKAEQGVQRFDDEKLCRGSPDLRGFYTEMRKQGPAKLRAGVQEQLSRPGPPTFGDCI